MNPAIPNLIDLQTYPLDQPNAPAWQALVQRCRADLDASGMFELPGFLKAQALADCVATITPRMASASAEIRRDHNIYFLDRVEAYPKTTRRSKKSRPSTIRCAPTNCATRR